MPIYHVHIDPIDPLLFGDSRSARAGLDHAQFDQDPSPLTVHGALGTFILDRTGGWPCDALGERQNDVLAPGGQVAELLGFTYLSAAGSPLFPRPRHLRCRLGARAKLLPVDLLTPTLAPADARASSERELEQLLLAPDSGGTEEIDEYEGEVWLSEHVLREVLCGHAPSTDVGLWPESEVFRPEARPGIAVDNLSGNLVEGAFFTRPYRRFQPAPLDPRNRSAGAGLTAWLRTLAPFAATDDEVGFLGGDRRRARFAFETVGEKNTEIFPDLIWSDPLSSKIGGRGKSAATEIALPGHIDDESL